MPKCPHPRKHHRNITDICPCDDFFIADRASGLDDCRNAMSAGFVDRIGEWEESVACHHGAARLFTGFPRGQVHGIHSACLPAADAESCTVFCEYNRVALGMFGHLPRKEEIGDLSFRWFFFGNTLKVVLHDRFRILVLNEHATEAGAVGESHKFFMYSSKRPLRRTRISLSYGGDVLRVTRRS